MVHQPPSGARDLLPLDVAQKISIERRLQQVFHRWGYHRIITSTLERLETLMAGGAIDRSTLIQLQDAVDGELGLRPELTASIARAAVMRMAGTPWQPQRLYYNANVFRKGPDTGSGGQQEFYQAGVELLGSGGTMADAEVLLLLSECLQGLEIDDWHLVLGEAGLTASLLEPFPPNVRSQVRGAIANLDRVGLENLPLSTELRERALLLFDLRGRPEDVFPIVAKLDLDEPQQAALNNLKSAIELLYKCQSQIPNLKSHIHLDLSLIQTFDYYTGIVFEVVSSPKTGQRVLGQGGRYDRLLGLFDPKRQNHAGIGFCLNIEDLHQILLNEGQLAKETPASDFLVVPQTSDAEAEAFVYARKLRESSDVVRVEIDLESRETVDGVREYARDRRIAQIAWVNAEGFPTIEMVN
ncbi:MAG: ATP phosphoribosyltransferase regulatory subunit [Oscillatoriales cyanobacterium]|uniref:ATP phosphoribosyltransferase regulatory subunit n=1 Tax=Microcoleus anatoxicus PTRS2 TaxID=2705321 RepID=A0ABU8YKU4_9CYAN|nr:MAG: ATP phosphoribosyltransferase regulatory subunit [Oscillatoriales cyanobacterium]TAD95079.1 MAG: ATP phosphoribosyltransferase regulatory subunit [Oscillatoriales cyanobacterium]TAE02563.1 MAG: ATP phosphoribosyltransferase regulatory subunit [Oscillatoriales cyanobacterium]TAE99269.1 MAG: ATP phosphoribosyltransferase regulatory subunit [Oscillatoriales cyanobacterium]TAF33374.1 MAG: ATP phosphoribosyltransferase regulatory subunit [Oscillatoriales cyanobacterium]